jgi:hypothetical protein
MFPFPLLLILVIVLTFFSFLSSWYYLKDGSAPLPWPLMAGVLAGIGFVCRDIMTWTEFISCFVPALGTAIPFLIQWRFFPPEHPVRK